MHQDHTICRSGGCQYPHAFAKRIMPWHDAVAALPCQNQGLEFWLLLQEVLRMYPPVGIGQIRVAEKHDLVLGGKLKIPAGTIMWVSA
jgi:cytochrome P450